MDRGRRVVVSGVSEAEIARGVSASRDLVSAEDAEEPRWFADAERAVRCMLGGAGVQDGNDRRAAWMALRMFAVQRGGLEVVRWVADQLGVLAEVDAARLDDPFLLHPLQFPTLNLDKLPDLTLIGSGDIASASNRSLGAAAAALSSTGSVGSAEIAPASTGRVGSADIVPASTGRVGSADIVPASTGSPGSAHLAPASPGSRLALSRLQVRRVVELLAFGRRFLPHPMIAPLLAAIAPEDRLRLAQALPRSRPWMRAIAQLADSATRTGMRLRAAQDGSVIDLDALCTASHAELWRFASSPAKPVRRRARRWLDLSSVSSDELSADDLEAAERVAVSALERAMVDLTRWPADRLGAMARDRVVGPPLARVVLGAFRPGRPVVPCILVDNVLVDARGAAIDLGGASVGVVHPVELSAEHRDTFAPRVGDQPFDQLARAIYTFTDNPPPERGVFVPGRLLALLDRGWKRYSDGQYIRGIYRLCLGDLAIEIAFDMHWQDFREFAGSAEIDARVEIEGGTWAVLHPVDYSEVLRELHRCGRPPRGEVDAQLEAKLIAAAGTDRMAAIALADHYLSVNDPRGELIALDERDRDGALLVTVDRDTARRFLELVAEHGFPRYTDPDAALRSVDGAQFYVNGRAVHVSRRPDALAIYDGERTWFHHPLIDGDEAFNVCLHVVVAGLTAGTPMAHLVFPGPDEIRAHPCYRLGPWPTYALPEGFAASYRDQRRLQARDVPRFLALWERLKPSA